MADSSQPLAAAGGPLLPVGATLVQQLPVRPEFPADVLLQVLQHVRHADLLRCLRVSRLVRSLIHDSTALLDRLFRVPPRLPVLRQAIADRSFVLHPLLQGIGLLAPADPHAPYTGAPTVPIDVAVTHEARLRPRGTTGRPSPTAPVRLSKCPAGALLETATSPAVGTLSVVLQPSAVGRPRWFHLERPEAGVTVADVLDAVCALLNKGDFDGDGFKEPADDDLRAWAAEASARGPGERDLLVWRAKWRVSGMEPDRLDLEVALRLPTAADQRAPDFGGSFRGFGGAGQGVSWAAGSSLPGDGDGGSSSWDRGPPPRRPPALFRCVFGSQIAALSLPRRTDVLPPPAPSLPVLQSRGPVARRGLGQLRLVRLPNRCSSTARAQS